MARARLELDAPYLLVFPLGKRKISKHLSVRTIRAERRSHLLDYALVGLAVGHCVYNTRHDLLVTTNGPQDNIMLRAFPATSSQAYSPAL